MSRYLINQGTTNRSTRSTVPHEVVGMVISKGYSLLKAWRVFMRLTQKDVAKALGISQSAVSQIEKTGVIPRKYTLEKLASVLNVDAKLIID